MKPPPFFMADVVSAEGSVSPGTDGFGSSVFMANVSGTAAGLGSGCDWTGEDALKDVGDAEAGPVGAGVDGDCTGVGSGDTGSEPTGFGASPGSVPEDRSIFCG
jgi:hypothetical protein